MSDDLSIPNPAYRMPQPRGGMDPAPRRLMMYAGGLVAAAVVIGGVSMLFSHQSAGPVPVVSADPRPLRVKPENPGGMQIAGWRADRAADGDQPGKLAPGPETPDPALLQAAPSGSPADTPDAGVARSAPSVAARSQADAPATASRSAGSPGAAPQGATTQGATTQGATSQGTASQASTPQVASQTSRNSVAGTQSAKTPPVPTPVPTVTTVAPRTATVLAPPPGARPVPSPTPVTPPTQVTAPGGQTGTLTLPAGRSVPATQLQQVAMRAPAPPATNAAPAATKPVSVQLAALLTEDAARNEWQQMEHRMPDVLGSHTPSFSRFERDGRTYWRVRVSGFGDIQQAKTFCDRVRAKNASCSVADF